MPQRLFLTTSRPDTSASSATAFRRKAAPMPLGPLSALFQSIDARLKLSLPAPTEPKKLSDSVGFLVIRLM